MLEGVRIVELGVWVAGPGAAGILSDWGADVIKVEAPAGDPMRAVFGVATGSLVTESPPFELDNRGKRSVVLDLRREEGLEAMRALLATADVFLTNVRPDALERLGLDPARLRAEFPRLVVASVSGYGLRGPDRDRAGYDIGAFWARTGVAATLAPEGEPPSQSRSAFGDHTTAVTALAGICGALFERERTGEGRLVEVSLLRTGIYCMGWDLGVQLRLGRLAPTQPRETAFTPLVNCYRGGDDRWFWLLGLEADRHWPGLLAAIEREDLGQDPRFAKARDRRRAAAELIAELDAVFATRPRSEWIERFDRHGVWWAPVHTAADVLEDPQARAAGAFVEIPSPDGPLPAVASPIDFDGVPTPARGPVPGLGEHTDEVLGELGYDAEAIARVRGAASAR